jgi:DNA replication and repair protein RecF
MALKLAELQWMRDTIGEWPVLLLDEVIAELDASRRAYLLSQVNGVSQALLTTTEPDIFTDEFLQRAARWHVHQGQIISAAPRGRLDGMPARGDIWVAWRDF